MLFPAHIKKIFVVAPAGRVPPEKTRRTARRLRRLGCNVVLGDSVDASAPFRYLAATAETRAADLCAAWSDPTVDLVVSLRGGYGSAQLVPLLDWKLLRSRNVPFLGYSDLTALHLAMHSRGVGMLVSGPMFTHFDELRTDSYTAGSMYKTLEPKRRSGWGESLVPPAGGAEFTFLKRGEAEGPLIPVTLSVLSSMLGTDFLPDLTGAVLLLEDVGEPVYKLDRYLTHLRMAGVLEKIAGLALGDFARCGRVKERMRLFNSLAAWVDGPVVSGVPFGHCRPRISAVFGSMTRITSSSDGMPRLVIAGVKT